MKARTIIKRSKLIVMQTGVHPARPAHIWHYMKGEADQSHSLQFVLHESEMRLSHLESAKYTSLRG